MRFSERYGHKPVREALQKDSMDEGLRNRLWNAVDLYFRRPMHEGGRGVPAAGQPNHEELFRLWTCQLKLPWDTISNKFLVHLFEHVRDYFFKCEWYEVYDLLEFVAERLEAVPRARFTDFSNRVLAEERTPYRFAGTRLLEITSEQEIAAIEQALHDAEPLTGVRSHLETALDHYANREKPDYRNSIKESISAIESLACLLTEDRKATLGKALNEIEKTAKVELHGALRKAFDVLYGYTSDEDGVRHKMLEEGRIGRAEALYMLVACSGFVSYLVSKAAEGRIELHAD